jgi:tight adherence protein C
MEPLVVVSAGLASVAAVATFLGMRAAVVAPRAEVLDRARRVTRAGSAEPVGAAPGGSVWAALLGPLAPLARPKDAEEMSRARRKLVHAGFRGEHALEVFFGAKIALAILLGGALLVASALQASPVPKVRVLAVILVTVAFYAPNVWVQRLAKARQTKLAHSLADALDLLVTCVEAGLGVDAALARIAKEIAVSAPELASELRQTTMEIHAGMVRAEAFRRMAERTGVEELRSLSAMIIQTEMFGTSIARALRVHASSMRVRRSHAAEERATTAAVKMLVPLILCILPSLFAVILGPAIVRISTLLLPAMSGGH